MNKFAQTVALTAALGTTLSAPSTAAAPSDVFIASNYTSVPVNSSAQVLSLTVPVGTYAVNAKVASLASSRKTLPAPFFLKTAT